MADAAVPDAAVPDAGSETRRRSLRQRVRWVIYPSLAVLLGVCALFYFGTFARLRIRPALLTAVSLSQPRSLSGNASANSKILIGAYATPGAYAAYWQALRSGNYPRLHRLEQAGSVISVPSGTLLWYHPKTEKEVLTPVHLLGSKYVGRTYWVASDDLRAT